MVQQPSDAGEVGFGWICLLHKALLPIPWEAERAWFVLERLPSLAQWRNMIVENEHDAHKVHDLEWDFKGPLVKPNHAVEREASWRELARTSNSMQHSSSYQQTKVVSICTSEAIWRPGFRDHVHGMCFRYGDFFLNVRDFTRHMFALVAFDATIFLPSQSWLVVLLSDTNDARAMFYDEGKQWHGQRGALHPEA